MDKFQDFRIHSENDKESFSTRLWRILRRAILPVMVVAVCCGIGYYYFRSPDRVPVPQTITIYSWTDADGARRYSDDRPPDTVGQITETVGPAYQDESFLNRTVRKIKKALYKGWQGAKTYVSHLFE